jgi:hypothetical protein
MGQDRFFNRYWWFDGAIGTSSDSSFFAPKGKYRKNSGWASGYLFVEDFGLNSAFDSNDPVLDNFKTGYMSGKWGYYSEVQNVILKSFLIIGD